MQWCGAVVAQLAMTRAVIIISNQCAKIFCRINSVVFPPAISFYTALRRTHSTGNEFHTRENSLRRDTKAATLHSNPSHGTHVIGEDLTIVAMKKQKSKKNYTRIFREVFNDSLSDFENNSSYTTSIVIVYG